MTTTVAPPEGVQRLVNACRDRYMHATPTTPRIRLPRWRKLCRVRRVARTPNRSTLARQRKEREALALYERLRSSARYKLARIASVRSMYVDSLPVSAEDLVQGAYARAWPTLANADNVQARMFTALYDELSDVRRNWEGRTEAEATRKRSPLRYVPPTREFRDAPLTIDDIATAPDVFDGLELRESLRRALDTLPGKHREAVLLTVVGGHTHASAARLLKCDRSSVDNWKARGLEALRQQLQYDA